MAVLGTAIKLDVDVGALGKSGSDREMNRLLQGGFGGLKVFGLGFEIFRAGIHHQFGGGFGRIINNVLGLVQA